MSLRRDRRARSPQNEASTSPPPLRHPAALPISPLAVGLLRFPRGKQFQPAIAFRQTSLAAGEIGVDMQDGDSFYDRAIRTKLGEATSSASRRAALSAFSLAAPALMSSPRVRTPIAAGRLRRESSRSYLQAHSIELPPDCDVVVIGVTEGYVKFRRQMNNIRQQQPNARGREISHRTFDNGILLEQDHTRLGALVPRGQSPFNASIHSDPQLRSCCRLATARLSLRGRPKGYQVRAAAFRTTSNGGRVDNGEP
jgi:hypothetical protein